MKPNRVVLKRIPIENGKVYRTSCETCKENYRKAEARKRKTIWFLTLDYGAFVESHIYDCRRKAIKARDSL